MRRADADRRKPGPKGAFPKKNFDTHLRRGFHGGQRPRSTPKTKRAPRRGARSRSETEVGVRQGTWIAISAEMPVRKLDASAVTR
jgi:hypothetical protein